MSRRKKNRQPWIDEKPASQNVFTIALIGVFLGFVGGFIAGRATDIDAEPVSTAQTQAVPNASGFGQSESLLRSRLQRDPKDLDALIHLGNLYYDHGRFSDAVQYYGRALEIDPGNANVRTDRGTSFYNLGMADRAIEEFRLSLEADPTHPQALYNLGVVSLHGKNDGLAARSAWQKLLEAHPNHPDRARIESQIASLSPQQPATTSSAKGNIVDLLERMKQ